MTPRRVGLDGVSATDGVARGASLVGRAEDLAVNMHRWLTAFAGEGRMVA